MRNGREGGGYGRKKRSRGTYNDRKEERKRRVEEMGEKKVEHPSNGGTKAVMGTQRSREPLRHASI